MRCPCSRSPDNDIAYQNGFDDQQTRRHFVSKVCMLVAFQMCFTAIVTSSFVFNESWGDWLKEHWWIAVVALCIDMVIIIMMCYCVFLFRKPPCNYILLIIFTCAKSIAISFICVHYAQRLVLYAVGVTALLCIVLTLFAMFAPCDFTSCWPLVLVALFGLAITGIFFIFFSSRLFHLIIVCAALIIFSFILVIDIQMIIGGKHSNQYDEDDYVIASISIYCDIIQIFLCLLELFGILDD
ncbi:protein lifeguard 1 [Drosophila tropicalis]|uniref:protein lifeguard 1 n=1 Tax=Drosophila tropicalis TaxID=46794 RepID=UPI0035ABA5F1